MKLWNMIDRQKFLWPIALSWIIIAFGIFADTAIIPHFINSDTLQPTQMAWEMTRNADAVTSFQWSRVPSFPDLAFFFTMEWAGIGWRSAFLLYTCLVAATATLALGWVVARMRASSYREGAFWAGIAVTAGLLAILAGITTAQGDEASWVPQSFLFLCNFHGDAFLLSVLASCTALDALRGQRRQAWLTYGICLLGTASDTIFLGYFLMPFALAVFLSFLRHRHAPSPDVPAVRTILRFLLLTGLACLIGWIVKYPLPMQAMQLNFPGLEIATANVLRDLPRQPWIVMLLLVTLGLAICALRRLVRVPDTADPAAPDFDQDLLLFMGLGASAASLGLAVLLFVDIDIYRYAIPFFWWPLTLGLGLLPRPRRRTPAAVVAVLATMATAALPLSASALPRWRAPLEKCLSDHRAEWGLKAGLATYWNSRITMVSSNWALQVDQINDTGDAYLWGNNVAAYGHDMHAPQRAPEYNFIVVEDLGSQFDIETNYGPAARVESCAGAEILIYEEAIIPPGTPYSRPRKREVDPFN